MLKGLRSVQHVDVNQCSPLCSRHFPDCCARLLSFSYIRAYIPVPSDQRGVTINACFTRRVRSVKIEGGEKASNSGWFCFNNVNLITELCIH